MLVPAVISNFVLSVFSSHIVSFHCQKLLWGSDIIFKVIALDQKGYITGKSILLNSEM